MNNQLYFIAIVPDEPVQSEIIEFKNISKDRFNSRKSLNSPGHITLVPPFKYPTEKEAQLIEELKHNVEKTNAFYVICNGFGRFDKKVIFIKIENNKSLNRLYTSVNECVQLKTDFQINKTRKFHPHITIAFRDLKPEYFKKAWTYFNEIEYQRLFQVHSICLLKHNGSRWDIVKNISF